MRTLSFVEQGVGAAIADGLGVASVAVVDKHLYVIARRASTAWPYMRGVTVVSRVCRGVTFQGGGTALAPQPAAQLLWGLDIVGVRGFIDV